MNGERRGGGGGEGGIEATGRADGASGAESPDASRGWEIGLRTRAGGPGLTWITRVGLLHQNNPFPMMDPAQARLASMLYWYSVFNKSDKMTLF